ncbi:hypothetical protein PoB_005783200 [Plakobranchus ocellatus]|uniref:Uncharacterized protein n=1 Tax=Plakobranchus ocellatus TaxID=259542 RepID=A0AAV4CIN3_9GAST|nr:hypothetical protein PoB_005783200 [Plakobranchus ocellatus]
MRGRGRVRMPREYFKKKEEARRRLLAESANHSVRSTHSGPRSQAPSVNLNGQPPYQSVDRDCCLISSVLGAFNEQRLESKKAWEEVMEDNENEMGFETSWVQGWNQNSGPREVETLDATIVLGEEQDEEFKIETVLVDNEVLDVGPYKDNHPDDQPVKGDVYQIPYIYSAGDKTSNGAAAVTSSQITSTAGTTLASSTPRDTASAAEMVEVSDNLPYYSVEEVQKLEDMVVQL